MQRLTTAYQAREPVTVHRKHLEFDTHSGFVIAVADDWIVLQDLAESQLDAVVLLRLDLVTKVERHENREFVSRVVAGSGVPLAEFDCPRDVSTRDLLRLVDARAELVCIYLETRNDYWLNIGKVLRIGEKRVDLHFIGRDGVWANFVESWKIRDITRIEFGGRYIGALEKFGEPIREVAKTIRR